MYNCTKWGGKCGIRQIPSQIPSQTSEGLETGRGTKHWDRVGPKVSLEITKESSACFPKDSEKQAKKRDDRVFP